MAEIMPHQSAWATVCASCLFACWSLSLSCLRWDTHSTFESEFAELGPSRAAVPPSGGSGLSVTQFVRRQPWYVTRRFSNPSRRFVLAYSLQLTADMLCFLQFAAEVVEPGNSSRTSGRLVPLTNLYPSSLLSSFFSFHELCKYSAVSKLRGKEQYSGAMLNGFLCRFRYIVSYFPTFYDLWCRWW